MTQLRKLFTFCHNYMVCCEQVPPPGKGSLYIRPLLMGSGPVLGLAPAPEYTFLVYASPVGNYFKVGAFFILVRGIIVRKTQTSGPISWVPS